MNGFQLKEIYFFLLPAFKQNCCTLIYFWFLVLLFIVYISRIRHNNRVMFARPFECFPLLRRQTYFVEIESRNVNVGSFINLLLFPRSHMCATHILSVFVRFSLLLRTISHTQIRRALTQALYDG